MSGATETKHGSKATIRVFESVSQRTLADVFGVVPKTIRDWQKMGLPRNPDDSYSVPDVVRWRCDYLTSINEDAVMEGSSQALKDEYTRLKIQHSEADLAIKRGEWASRSDVETVLGTIADRIRETVEGAERRFGGEAFDYLIENLGAEALGRLLKKWMPGNAGANQGELTNASNSIAGSNGKS